jgi:hypothetical protein
LLSFPACEERVDTLINFPFREAAVAGGCLEFDGNALVLSAPLPKFAHGIYADIGPGREIAEIRHYVLDPGEERIPRQAAQFY